MVYESSILVSRLKKFMDKKNLNARQLAEKASVGRSFVYDILSGKSTNPTTRKLASVAKVLEVSVPYLLGGIENSYTNDNKELVEGEKSFLPILEYTESEEEKIAFYLPKQFFKESFAYSEANLRAITIKADNMEPALKRKDVAIIDTSCKTPIPPGIFIMMEGNNTAAHRLEFCTGGNNSSVRIISDNSNYGTYENKIDNVDILGRVVWVSRWV